MKLSESLQRHGVDTTALTAAEYQRPGDGLTYVLRVAAPQARASWEHLHGFLPEIGYCPVIGWDRFKQLPWEEELTADILAEATRSGGKRWFGAQDTMRLCAQELDASRETNLSQQAFTFRIPFHRFSRTVPGLAPIALVLCEVSWKVPAYLRFSKDSNPPQDHAVVQKYWYERWGAELVGWDGGNAELRAPRLPVSADEACVLAAEQYEYCPDLVWQNVGSVTALARILIASNVWWFWWD